MAAFATTAPETIVREIRSLAPLPLTAQRLLAMANAGDQASAAELADLAEHDPALTALLLRYASGSTSSANLREIVLRLGVVPMLDLVIDGYLDQLRRAAPLYDLTEDDLWAHGAAARLAAAAIRRETSTELPALTETAALLHDIGKLVLTRHLGRHVQELLAYARMRRTTFVAAERALLGTDHAEVGAAMAAHWRFPEPVRHAIARHHAADEEPSPLLDAVVLANVAAKTVETGLGAEGLNFRVDPASFRRLGLGFPAFGRVCLAADAGLRRLRAARASGATPS